MRADRTLVLASGNPGKLREINELLDPLGYSVVPQSQWQVPQAAEDRPTFIENALLKARNAALHCGLPALADDSGLVVPALGGSPGVHSARYAGAQASDRDNNAKLLEALSGLPAARRQAYFHCAMVLVSGPDDPVPLVASASWWGSVLEAPRGAGGFGYDPLFLVEEQGCSSAELPATLKNQLSHRGQALRALLAMVKARVDAEG